MRIEVICTGDEVLSGKTVNTNFSRLSRRLTELGMPVVRETTVGDNRAELRAAFDTAAGRADAVIVNGGLGPTVDDLSQEVAAEAAGVPLALRPEWLENIQAFYRRRNREMPPNNRKQAMLPEGAELIDNPVGTACGFALDIGGARFFFTPGVPSELDVMTEDQLIPRLRAMSGIEAVMHLKRFHSFGIGESRADHMLAGIEAMDGEGRVKLGFQSHYPQLETKLAVAAPSREAAEALLEPMEEEVRRRLGHFIVAEDDGTLEGAVLERLRALGGTLSTVETGSQGGLAARLAAAGEEGGVFLRASSGNDMAAVARPLGLPDDASPMELAEGVRRADGATHGLAAAVDPGTGRVHVALAGPEGGLERRALLIGGARRARQGGVELALDCLRRSLAGAPVDQKIDFEKA